MSKKLSDKAIDKIIKDLEKMENFDELLKKARMQALGLTDKELRVRLQLTPEECEALDEAHTLELLAEIRRRTREKRKQELQAPTLRFKNDCTTQITDPENPTPPLELKAGGLEPGERVTLTAETNLQPNTVSFAQDGNQVMMLTKEHIVLYQDDKELVRVSMKNASVQFGEDANINEAAKQFWRAIAIVKRGIR